MCLHSVIGKPKKTRGVGYKVFVKGFSPDPDFPDPLLGENCFGERDRPVEEWLNAHEYGTGSIILEPLGYQEFTPYKTGWHIFPRLKDARAWVDKDYLVVRKVRYRGAHTEGTQYYSTRPFKVVVAEEIYIERGDPS